MNTIRFCAGGDVALGGALETSGQQGDTLFAAINGVFDLRGINFVNLDCTLDATGMSPNPDEFLVSAKPDQLKLLQRLGISVVSQANNHSTDFGATSLGVSESLIAEIGIESVGAGVHLTDARSSVVISKEGIKVGFLAYASTHPWVGSTAATPMSAGVAPLVAEYIREDVEELRPGVDAVIISAHWGKEYLHYPAPEIVNLARSMIDWGADIIIGHHPHVMQGIERYGRGTICYSLGNLLFPDYPGQGLRFANADTRRSLVVRFLIGEGHIELESVVPLKMELDGRLTAVQGAEREAMCSKVDVISSQLSDENYVEFWHREARKFESKRLLRVLREEIVQAGWRKGSCRLVDFLSRKSLRSVGRSLSEIVDVRSWRNRS